MGKALELLKKIKLCYRVNWSFCIVGYLLYNFVQTSNVVQWRISTSDGTGYCCGPRRVDLLGMDLYLFKIERSLQLFPSRRVLAIVVLLFNVFVPLYTWESSSSAERCTVGYIQHNFAGGSAYNFTPHRIAMVLYGEIRLRSSPNFDV